MIRINYKCLMAFLALLLICTIPVFSQEATTPSTVPILEGLNISPYLQNATQNSIVIMWETTEPVVGTVNYGDSENMGSSVSESSPAKIHEVKITGLEPGKTYYYQASYGNVKTPPSKFKTAPPDGTKDFILAVYGDSRSDPVTHSKIVALMSESNPDLIIHTGDLVSSGTVYERWKPEFFTPLSKLSDHVPFYTCLGNHEGNSPNYYNYLSLPGNEIYYSFDYANAHFICLDTNSGNTPYDESSPQYKWLIEDLEKNKNSNKWIIVFFHAPLFRVNPTRGIEPQRYLWQPIFDKYGVDLVLNGHDHNYSRTYSIGYLSDKPKKGVHHVIAGGGGAPLYDVVENRNYIEVVKKSYNAMIIKFKDDKLRAVVNDLNRITIDSFTLDRTQTASSRDYVAFEMFELERDFRNTISKLNPVVINSPGQNIVINTTLTVKWNSSMPLRAYLTWTVPGKTGQEKATGANTKWKFITNNDKIDLKPGTEFQIPINATVDYADIYPVPALNIRFKKAKDVASIGFRNDDMTIYPIKILYGIPVDVSKTKEVITIDGDMKDTVWTNALQLSDFVTVSGSAKAKNGIQVKLANDGKNIYVSAELKGDPEKYKLASDTKPLARDDKSISSGENLNINLSDGETIYTFVINPQDSQFDAKNGDNAWNAEWIGKTSVTDKSWIAEIAIPLSVFGDNVQKKPLYIDIGRLDKTENEEVVLAPTFTVTERENRLPEYIYSIKYPKLLPKLILKDSQTTQPSKQAPKKQGSKKK